MKISFFAGDKNTKICGAAKLECYSVIKNKFWSSESFNATRGECNCLSGCTSITYNAEIERTVIDYRFISEYVYFMHHLQL